MAAHKKNARRLRATLVFVDESGFSLLPTACRTWSPRGQTPILRHCFNWPKLSAISAVTSNPHAYFHLIPDTIASPEVIRYAFPSLSQSWSRRELGTDESFGLLRGTDPCNQFHAINFIAG